MPLTFPLPLEAFALAGKIRQSDFTLGEAMSSSETGGGHILRAATGTRLWSGSMEFVDGRPDDQEAFEALLDALREPGGSFLIGDTFKRYPRSDPTGAIFGGATVTVLAVPSDRRQLAMKGGPAGATISAGDHLSLRVGTAAGPYSYHRVVVGGGFNGQGQAQVEVRPHLPLGLAAGNLVTLIRPRLKAIVVPGGHSSGARIPGDIIEGSSIRWTQTSR